MKHYILKGLCMVAPLAFFGISTAPKPAQAYPIDCAILLCLAGGFPPSVECSAARAKMIQRITPWPISPPLQLWNCPMGGLGSNGEQEPNPPFHLLDVKIKDYVNGIRVFEVNYGQKLAGKDEECKVRDTTYVNYYDKDGKYVRVRSSLGAVPAQGGFTIPSGYCPSIGYRAIYVEWFDEFGDKGFERVDY